MTWSLYHDEKFLEPLKFSNGKTQEDVVKEVLGLIEKGEKIIFIRGVCGTGKCLDKESLIFCTPLDKEYFRYYKISYLEGRKGKIISVDEYGNLVKSKFKNVRKTGKKRLHIFVNFYKKSYNFVMLLVRLMGREVDKIMSFQFG